MWNRHGRSLPLRYITLSKGHCWVVYMNADRLCSWWKEQKHFWYWIKSDTSSFSAWIQIRLWLNLYWHSLHLHKNNIDRAINQDFYWQIRVQTEMVAALKMSQNLKSNHSTSTSTSTNITPSWNSAVITHIRISAPQTKIASHIRAPKKAMEVWILSQISLTSLVGSSME